MNNRGESPEQVRACLDRFDYTFPVLLDSDESLYRHFSLFALPTSLTIDATSMVDYRHSGMLNQASLEEYPSPSLN
jgi:hypothetical protein